MFSPIRRGARAPFEQTEYARMAQGPPLKAALLVLRSAFRISVKSRGSLRARPHLPHLGKSAGLQPRESPPVTHGFSHGLLTVQTTGGTQRHPRRLGHARVKFCGCTMFSITLRGPGLFCFRRGTPGRAPGSTVSRAWEIDCHPERGGLVPTRDLSSPRPRWRRGAARCARLSVAAVVLS